MKSNLQGNYETLECKACGGDYETQEHILACTVINENRTIEKVHYDKLLKGTDIEKLKVAKLFEENFKILEDIKKSKWNERWRIKRISPKYMGPSDIFVLSAVVCTELEYIIIIIIMTISLPNGFLELR